MRHLREHLLSFTLKLLVVAWALALATVTTRLALAGEDVVRATHGIRVRVDPAAAKTFPNAQSSAACEIITITGLGSLDGDYTLVDPGERFLSPEKKPAWVRATLDKPHQMLSWLPGKNLWVVGMRESGRYNAFVPMQSDMPPVYSSGWRLFNEDSGSFEEFNNMVVVSCPGMYLRTMPLYSIVCEHILMNAFCTL